MVLRVTAQPARPPYWLLLFDWEEGSSQISRSQKQSAGSLGASFSFKCMFTNLFIRFATEKGWSKMAMQVLKDKLHREQSQFFLFTPFVSSKVNYVFNVTVVYFSACQELCFVAANKFTVEFVDIHKWGEPIRAIEWISLL